MKDNYSWAQMLDEFRQLGGKAENIEQRAGQFGNGIFPADAAKPVEIEVPASLLVNADHLILDGDDLVVSTDSGAPTEVREFINRYQKHFSWGADGRKNVESFESALKTLPEPLLQRLQHLRLVNLGIRHKGPWKEVLRQRFLQSRRINYHDRKVSMPIIELINHAPRSPGYLISEGIRFKGLFSDEVTVNYSPTSDSLQRFLNYGFANQEPGAYSLQMHLKLNDGATLHIGYDGSSINIVDKLPLPKLKVDGKRRTLSHLRLGIDRAPRLPRTLLRKALPDLPAALADETFERIRNANQLELCNLLELTEDANSPIGKQFRQALLFQLKSLATSYGFRPD